ncbi:SUMF1/EgtB/PvdO family nonheme iron enzyme [Candidatus Omnitrophota bacterium]
MKIQRIFFFLFCLLALSGLKVTAAEYSGMIVNDIGRPAAFAKITIENLADPEHTMSVVTDTTGTFSFTLTPSDVSAGREIPFQLYGNFPNPFNPQTRISYSVETSTEVVFEIYNVLGQHVRTLNDGYREPGFYTVSWNGLDEHGDVCSAGVYLYRMSAGGRWLSSKMLMMDSATASWVSGKRIPKTAFSQSEDILYMVTVVHPDAETVTVGPRTISGDGAYEVVTINRTMDKMQFVSKNTYTRGIKWYHYTRPLHKVQITRDFFMDKYEVTAEIFTKVMNHALDRGAVDMDTLYVSSLEGDAQQLFKYSTAQKNNLINIIYEDGVFKPRKGRERMPVNYINWYGAVFYCNERSMMDGISPAYDLSDWSCDFESPGYRLPSDAEWELAAAWTDGREYAYGPDPGHWYPMNTQLNADGFDDELSPVGWFSPQGDSHDGVSDMSGNVYEWTWSWMEYYKKEWADSILVDPKGPDKGWNKVIKGGSAYGCFRAGRVADKANVQITRTTADVGFRTIRYAE